MKKISKYLNLIFVIAALVFAVITGILNHYQIIGSILTPIGFGISFLLGGYYKAKEGVVKTIKNKSLNVEILMILGAVAAFSVKNYSEGTILILIFAISGLLEDYANRKSEQTLTSLLTLEPKQATLFNDHIEKFIDAKDLVINDLILVKPGEQVSADGVIIEGYAYLDQSAITGEFNPVFKKEGSFVYSGSINTDNAIIVKVTKNPKDSLMQKIIDLVYDAKNNHPKVQTKIDKIEKYYVYVVLLLAVIVMVIPPLLSWLTWSESFYRGIIVLVVGSPCALVASTAPAMLSSLSNAAKKRILVKGGKQFEILTSIKTIIFDKTGTITKGEFSVVDLVLYNEKDLKLVKDIFYSMELKSNHPIAKAITLHFKDEADNLNLTIKEYPGKGLECEYQNNLYQIGQFDYQKDDTLVNGMTTNKSVIPLIKNNKIIAYLVLEDVIKENAFKMIKELKALGINVVLASGDEENNVKTLANALRIKNYHSKMMPIDKVELAKYYQKLYGPVMMIGDGINDAPALAVADLGVSMGSGTDVSLETAEIIIMNNNLSSVIDIIKLAKRMRRIVYQNITFSILVIAVLLLTNAFGILVLPVGVFAHELSTILVILNSLRLLV